MVYVSVGAYGINGTDELNIHSNKDYLTHVVQEGEALSQISEKYY